MRHPFRLPVLLLAALSLTAAGAALSLTAAGAALPRPGDDFYGWANADWLAATTLPAGRASFATRDELSATAAAHVREIVQRAATHPGKDPIARKVGAWYAAFLDQDRIEARGLKPLASELAAIAAIHDRTGLSAHLGATLNSEVDGLTANADHTLGLFVNQGFADADHNLPHLLQGGLGLSNRDDYLDASPEKAQLRDRYRAHIAAVLKQTGGGDSDARAARVLALEVKLARSHAPDSDAADVFKQNNPWRRADFAVKAPGMDWTAWFRSAGLPRQRDFIVWQPSAVTGLAALVAGEDLAVWRDYLRLHLVDHYAAVLPRAVRDEHAAFYGAAPAREEEAIAAVNGALGQDVGRLYVRRWFPPRAKAKADAMGRDLIAAWRTRLAGVAWMAPETRSKAIAKLDAFRLGLGYPDRWIDDRSLVILRGDALGNLRRTEAFNRAHDRARLKGPVWPVDWPMNPQAVSANILFSPNLEVFSAALLQPPWFDADGDAASNYGSAGAGMAHEIGHSFDELGNIYDARGRLGDWWTPGDHDRYRAATKGLIAQYDAYCPFEGVCLNGARLLGENSLDLAGLQVAHDAYRMSLKGKPDVVINGLTGEQRLFRAYAQRWRRLQTEAAFRKQIATDTHAPGPWRAATVRNVNSWYAAFGVGPGDRLYLRPGDRLGVW